MQIQAELIPGFRGIFDVAVGADLLFSKQIVNRFPYLGEIADLLRQYQTKHNEKE